MSLNLWNIKSGKERIGIRQRTQAHKKHLISLVNMRSVIDDKFVKNDKIWQKHLKNSSSLFSQRNIKNSRSRDKSTVQNKKMSFNSNKKFTRIKSLKSDLIASRRIGKENEGLVNRIANIQKLKRSQTQGVRKFLDISNTLTKNSFSQRVMKQKKIQFENCKMFDRLVSTAPTIDRTIWTKSVKDNIKYKKNLMNCKYVNPDYTAEVTRQIEKNRGTMRHLQISQLQNNPYSYGNLPGIKRKIR